MAVNGSAHRNSEEQRRHTSTERIEMDSLVGPHSQDYDDGHDSDDGDDGDGERALLRSQRSSGLVTKKPPDDESTSQFVYGILIETIPTLLLTTVGLTFTGELLERVSDWRALKRVDELYILIPMLNNLKGNLEMNLSSRLSTAANIGELDTLSTRKLLLLGNLSLLQVQALLVSAVAALLSFLLGLALPSGSDASSSTQKRSLRSERRGRRRLVRQSPPESRKSKSGVRELAMLLSTSMASASLSGIILGSFMCSLILLCRRWHRDPDNITPPIASCLGDLVTLCVIGLVSSVLVRTLHTPLSAVLLVVFLVATVFSIMLTLRNESVRQLIYEGWTPLLGAMIISSGTGLVLDRFVNKYEGFGLLSIVVGGLPGAVGSVLVSRLSTTMHAYTSKYPHTDEKPKKNPRFLATVLTLSLVTLPVQALFLIFLHISGWMKLSFLFVGIFVVIFCATVLMSLAIADILTRLLWRNNLDPDSYAMPIHSSLVDFLGQLMLVVCYELAQALGADVKS